MHNPVLQTRVCEIIRLISAYNGELPLATELYADIYISGDDASDLFEMLSKEFGTSFTGMNLESFFPNETDGIWYYWWHKLSGRRPAFKSFTIDHLLMVVEEGQWFEPNVTAQRAPGSSSL